MATPKNNARLIDNSLFRQAGINPKTGLPIKFGDSGYSCIFKEAIKKDLRIIDEQNAVNRYIWHNLPCDISSQELERLLYYKGQLCFFYNKQLEKFFFMPYALSGKEGTGIDFYGRFRSIHPIPFANGTEDEKSPRYKNQLEYLSTLVLDVKYDIPLREITHEDIVGSAVLLHDYTKQLSQTIIPRKELNDPILDSMAECMPMMRTALRNSTGVLGMRVTSPDEASNVLAANVAIDKAVLDGQRYIPIEGQLEFQELAPGGVARAEEFMMSMQSMDNFRLSLYGLDNGGLYSKSQYQNQMEVSLNTGHAYSPLNDGLLIRQRFCDIVNGIYGLGISVEIGESALRVDKNGDGYATDEVDQNGIQGDQKEVMEGTINDQYDGAQ